MRRALGYMLVPDDEPSALAFSPQFPQLTETNAFKCFVFYLGYDKLTQHHCLPYTVLFL